MKETAREIRILVVDDAVVMRKLITDVLSQDPGLKSVGSAPNGKIALAKIPLCNPDVITLDIEMPEMDGLEALKLIKERYPHIQVIMFSSLTERGATKTLEALSLGASDYLTKPATASLELSLERLREELVPKIKQFFASKAEIETPSVPAPDIRTSAYPRFQRKAGKPQVVAIGVSTGGPNALEQVLPSLSADFPVPIVIVQHMPPMFTRLLAKSLNLHSQLEVREATDGEVLEPGVALIAPGDYHLTVQREDAGVVTRLNQETPQNYCRPAVDALFDSLAKVYGAEVLVVIMTGMGHDGLRGIQQLKEHGTYVIAQDEATSVVWGMPGVVVEGGLADAVLPVDQIAQEIKRLVSPAEHEALSVDLKVSSSRY